VISKYAFNSKLQICFCTEPEKIENYNLAISDKTETWHCHHRLETHFCDGTERPPKAQLTSEELIALGTYYFRPANELIFLTVSEHHKLHNKLSNFKMNAKGRKRSKETLQKMSIAQKLRGTGDWMLDGKQVICIETNEIFRSEAEACRWCKSSKVGAVCRGIRKTAGGYHWKFA
jgi:hypothetical protein